MAESAAAPRHRYFCHCCKREIDPKLPVSTMQRVTEMDSDCSRYNYLKRYCSLPQFYFATQSLTFYYSFVSDPFVLLYVHVKPRE